MGHQLNYLEGQWGMGLFAPPVFQHLNGEDAPWYINNDLAFYVVSINARKMANKIIASGGCCCKKVQIIFVEINRDGQMVNIKTQ